MHKLSRQVRFSLNPFLDDVFVGTNSYCSKPAGVGLSLYFSLRVELIGDAGEDTGFVVNITEIDKAVRELVVPVFDRAVKDSFRKGEHVCLARLESLLRQSRDLLSEYFLKAQVAKLSLELNPNKTLAIKEGSSMANYSEKFDFAAMHKLWNDKFSEEKNLELFGKCANPTGHGHNYTAQVTVEMDDCEKFSPLDYEKVIDDNFVEIVDHKNLNADIEFFTDKNPTVENIAFFAYQQLKGKFATAKLKEVAIWETTRTCCTYSE